MTYYGTPYGSPGYPSDPSGYPPAGYPPQGYGPYAPAGPRQYGMLRALFLFWSPRLWRNVGQRWRGIGFWYVVLLVAITFAGAAVWLSRAMDDLAKTVPPQVPKITIANGVATVDVPQPYYIREPHSGQILAILDTTGAVTAPRRACGSS